MNVFHAQCSGEIQEEAGLQKCCHKNVKKTEINDQLKN
jgi:hypothetical protein